MSVTGEPLKHPLAERLSAGFGHRYREGFVVTQPGGIVMAAEFLLDAQRILDFPVKEDDVWLVTFPKSGTTWTQELVWLLMNELDFKTAKESCITERFRYIERMCTLPKATRRGAPDTIQLAVDQPSPRLIKSHLPPALLPRQLWTVKPKIIYVARSPTDAATSYYYFNRLVHGISLSLDEFLECFLADVVQFTPYWTSVLEFWNLRNEPNILWNTYEEMKQDLGAVIRKTAAFLGKSVTDEQLHQLEGHLSFTSMRANRATNCSDVMLSLRTSIGLPPPPSDQTFMREGKVGQAKLHMSPEMNCRFDQWIQENIRGTGYDGPV
ncbi:luciferin sulfotransferase-like [Schistocerca serialis cubense]|uniref:luciferin sulfotransferase-like n=1 Tax=Schistocerca serialis cubense TaxID=2023355 RepID=UPI00214EBB84|nr:luciferin sulfotransferase-like [Schistocerca serialis cubense]